MKKFVILFFLLFTACDTYYYGSYVSGDLGDHVANVVYKSYKQLVTETDVAAQVQIQDSIWLKNALSQIPKYGCLFFRVFGPDPETANPRQWDFLVHNAHGKSLQRTQGHVALAYRPYNSYAWAADDIDTLKVAVPDTFVVYAICKPINKRSSFIIYKDNPHPNADYNKEY